MRRALTLTIIVICSAWLWAACAPREGRIDSYLGLTVSTDDLDGHVERRMGELDIPGAALAVVDGGEVVHHATYGTADPRTGRPVTGDTIFEAASISKPVFAHFVMTFVESGQLDLDRPLHDYLPHPDLDDPRAEAITARLVLSHQTGLPNWRADEPDGDLDIAFDPGTGYRYSGEGYQYLAAVLADLAGTDEAGLEALFQARVAEPLGLEHTVFVQTAHTRRHKAEPHDRDGARIAWESSPVWAERDGVFNAAASLHTEPADFARWMIGVMDGAVLSEAGYRELLAPQVQSPGEPVDYTLGFATPRIPLTDLYLHDGDNDGFSSFFVVDVEDDWGFVLFTNSDNGEPLAEELFDRLLAGPSLTRLALTIVAAIGLVVTVLAVAVGALVRRLRRSEERGDDGEPTTPDPATDATGGTGVGAAVDAGSTEPTSPEPAATVG